MYEVLFAFVCIRVYEYTGDGMCMPLLVSVSTRTYVYMRFFKTRTLTY